MQNFWGWLFDKAELNDKMPLNLPNKFKDEYERFLGTKIIATNNERMGKKPMRVIQTRLTTIDMEENKIEIYRSADGKVELNVKLEKDDIVEMITAGAGGYGPVSERDPEIIKREYKEGIIDRQWIENAGIDITL